MGAGEPAVWDDIELVELHDAIVERLEITREGHVRIELSHLVVYRRETAQSCGVWSFRAELRIASVDAMNVHGPAFRDAAESLEDVELVTADGRRLDPTSLLDGKGARVDTVRLRWAVSGTIAEFRGGSVSLTLVEALERVETWTGEL